MQYLLTNATIVLPDRVLEEGWLIVERGRIGAIGCGRYPQLPILPHFDLDGAYLLPGLIDLHCDAIEKLVQPRPGVEIDVGIALHAADRLLLGCGITCQFHALSLDDAEFGVRSDRFAHDFLHRLSAERHCGARHLVHARVEVSSDRGLTALQAMLGHPLLRLVSIMDHSPGQGQYTTEAAFRTYVAQTSGRSEAEIDQILARKRAAQAEIPRRIEQIIAWATRYGLPVASHDDDTPERVSRWAEYGVRIAEFPTTLPAAQAAHAAGMAVGMGAPNVLRGKSSGGNLSALTAIEAGVVDWLCADYYPASLLPVVFRLADRDTLSLPEAVALVSDHPARAVGLDHIIGKIQTGYIADLVVVRRMPDPVVQQVFVGGRPVYTWAEQHEGLPVARQVV
ncbi:alpha-D-ribose 1-methylphosphonate 5-triphosphate diphosphatase [Chloroflexus sp.]|uniref:alpha-D-ribose 1-methylphosphonate 5-triphosphate diphosphatase n=1 Tax=Chloroflexus sp. TaxID=1904827 RepID=UPI0026393DD4|nr:alpha-D-ribose 1-methylphosphonate 5-triphosphate diphosphatase [uncultured Chloroflexus sp.]